MADHRFASSTARDSRTSQGSLMNRLSLAGLQALIQPSDSQDESFRKLLVGGSQAKYPMHCLSMKDFLELEAPVDHQTLMRQGKLVVVDEDNKVPVFFLSHQWVISTDTTVLLMIFFCNNFLRIICPGC